MLLFFNKMIMLTKLIILVIMFSILSKAYYHRIKKSKLIKILMHLINKKLNHSRL